MLVRQLCASVALPGVVTMAIPVWLARVNHVSLTAPDDVAGAMLQGFGTVLLGVGLLLFCASVYYFWSRGAGTLAPWDPPRRFVVEGPYRFVRNPMISGVVFALLGEALVLRSRAHAEWAALFAGINVVYIPILEEPLLAARFGEAYRQYKRRVRRFVPRLKPWNQDAEG